MPIFKTDFCWSGMESLKVYIDGTKEQKIIISEAMETWNRFSGLKFLNCKDNSDSDIRVSFRKGKGNYSYVGTQALSVEKSEPTMNIENCELWVALHEFGHVLGLVHEHQHPKSGLKWNITEIQKDMKNWSTKTIKENIINTFDEQHYSRKEYDQKSIMHYEIPSRWLLAGNPVDRNETLSLDDVDMIHCLYPKKLKSKL